jgi:hypothetical protein
MGEALGVKVEVLGVKVEARRTGETIITLAFPNW